MRFALEEVEEAGPGITPLLDVVLLLLIFFVVTTSFVDPRIAVELPAVAQAGGARETPPLTVSLTADGGLAIDGEPASLAALASRLAEGVDPDREVELRADGRVEHARVVEVLDVARQHGVLHVGIAVRVGGGPGARGPAGLAESPGSRDNVPRESPRPDHRGDAARDRL